MYLYLVFIILSKEYFYIDRRVGLHVMAQVIVTTDAVRSTTTLQLRSLFELATS